MINRFVSLRAVRKWAWRPRGPAIPLALALLLGLLASCAVPAWADGWVIRCVDCPKYFSDLTDRSLHLDAAGHPHIAYGGDHLYYAWHDGTNWHYETADNSPGVGRQASLDLDGNGYPHIAYYDEVNDAVKYAYRDASGWHMKEVDAWIDNPDTPIALALDGDGYPHISYYDDSMWNHVLMYAYQDDSG
jgi:hypothetical protein